MRAWARHFHSYRKAIGRPHEELGQVQGCLIEGAAGDALGYPVELLDEREISRHYGPSGITSYELVDGVAQISDDTQMALFTVTGLLLGTTRGMMRGIMGSYPSQARATSSLLKPHLVLCRKSPL